MSEGLLDIKLDDVSFKALQYELGATPKQAELAMMRAFRRTASKLKTLTARGLKDELQLKAVKSLRKRLQSYTLKKGGLKGYKLWYGLNDLPIHWFKGKPSKTSTGASFRGVAFNGGFVGKTKSGAVTIFKRKGRASHPVSEQEFPIQEKAERYIERKVFNKIEAMFWAEFERDLRARVKYQLGEH